MTALLHDIQYNYLKTRTIDLAGRRIGTYQQGKNMPRRAQLEVKMKPIIIICIGLLLVAAPAISSGQEQSLADYRREHNLGSVDAETRPRFVGIFAELVVDGNTESGHVMLVWTSDGNPKCPGCALGVPPGAYVVLNTNTTTKDFALKPNMYSVAEWKRRYPAERFRLLPYGKYSSIDNPDHYKDLTVIEKNLVQEGFCQQGLNLYDHKVEDKNKVLFFDLSKMVNVCLPASATRSQTSLQETKAPDVTFPVTRGQAPIPTPQSTQATAQVGVTAAIPSAPSFAPVLRGRVVDVPAKFICLGSFANCLGYGDSPGPDLKAELKDTGRFGGTLSLDGIQLRRWVMLQIRGIINPYSLSDWLRSPQTKEVTIFVFGMNNARYKMLPFEGMAPEQQAAVQDFCAQGLRIYGLPKAMGITEYRESRPGVSDLVPICGPGVSSSGQPNALPPASAAASVSTSVHTSLPVRSGADPIPASTPIPKPQSQFTVHVSRSENLISPSQSDIKNAPHTVLLGKKNGKSYFVGLFKIGSDFWFDIYEGTRGSDLSTEYYSYAALQEQGLVNLYLGPESYWVGNNNHIGILDPMIAQACRSNVHISVDTGTGVVDACKAQ